MKVIISLGSNTNQEENIQHAREILSHLIPDAEFTEPIWTDPIAENDRPAGENQYLNCLVEGHVHLSEGAFLRSSNSWKSPWVIVMRTMLRAS